MDKTTLKKKDIKKAQVDQLAEKITKAKTIIFSDYHGLSAETLNHLRAKIKKAGGQLIITKNSLLKIALSRNQLPVTSSQLEGPTATLFSFEDEIAPLKEVATVVKSTGFPKYKFGFFQKTLLSDSEIENLAQIPSRETLEAKVVGSLASPLYGIVTVLSANIRNLVSVLDQASKQHSQSA